MAAKSGGSEADELIGEVAGSAVNEMGNAMATTSGDGGASEPIGEASEKQQRKKKSKRTSVVKPCNHRAAAQHEHRDRGDAASRNTGGQPP